MLGDVALGRHRKTQSSRHSSFMNGQNIFPPPSTHILPRAGEGDKKGGKEVEALKIFSMCLASFTLGFTLANVIWTFHSFKEERKDRNRKASKTDKQRKDGKNF